MAQSLLLRNVMLQHDTQLWKVLKPEDSCGLRRHCAMMARHMVEAHYSVVITAAVCAVRKNVVLYYGGDDSVMG